MGSEQKGTNFFQQNDAYWEIPIPAESIHFVDSPESEEFILFLSALEQAYIVGMDAEWKPLTNRKVGVACPRVSIMQIACRLRTGQSKSETEEHSSELLEAEERLDELFKDDEGSAEESLRFEDKEEQGAEKREAGKNVDKISINKRKVMGNVTLDKQQKRSNEEESAEQTEQNGGILVDTEALLDRMDVLNLSRSGLLSGRKKVVGKEEMMSNLLSSSDGTLEGGKDQELIFILDLLALPAWTFSEAMKRMLGSWSVLKLGFRFKQDLINLAASFPGSDSLSCFDKVEPYVDVGKLYLESGGFNAFESDAKRMTATRENLSLAMICEEILGIPLCKDLQCSDWEQRPLTSEQLVYAAADAQCLLAIYDALETEATTQAQRGQEIFDFSESGLSTGIGIAQVLLPGKRSLSGCHRRCIPGTILRASCVPTSTMVKATLEGRTYMAFGLTTTDGPPAFSNFHLRIAQKFGERLLGNAGNSSKVGRRKPKTHRENNGRCKGEQQEVNGWCGPSPWDPSCGGDGFPKFLCDVMVEGLARQLRNVGIDTACPHVPKSDPRQLVEQAEREGRVLLTRDVKLLRRRLVPQNLAYRVKSLAKQDQLAEVIHAFKLRILEDQLLSRCTKCNGEFIPKALTPEEAVASAPHCQVLPEYALKERLQFWQCSVCQHMYWQGNQFHRALETFQALARKMQKQIKE